jgi:hypothetical protein
LTYLPRTAPSTSPMRHPDFDDEWDEGEVDERHQQLRVESALQRYTGRELEVAWRSDPWGQVYAEARFPGHTYATYVVSLNGEMVCVH